MGNEHRVSIRTRSGEVTELVAENLHVGRELVLVGFQRSYQGLSWNTSREFLIGALESLTVQFEQRGG